ncbi:nitrite reductase (NADH) small subunit [Wenyingzhuangia heitensis]|uniref:Nitrite reductase (NADH) small subunit n=1 Tax=Wenyingzhuangia heitensis TaxID=1487859 RepID=A0ABX0UA90_9FLAO|nr:nitrite reductase small subunit NirD [Wenyingzhuangia heitensis]NIJ44396.1 nitrite reductase (NADH) small subunit [Wenyingzhuangia heitensis]
MDTLQSKYKTVKVDEVKEWFKAAPISAFSVNGGACVKYKDLQIAVFNFERFNNWYACQNLSPAKNEMVLSRGMLGDHKGVPKIACPLLKNTFSLETGENLNGDLEPIAIYPVKIKDGFVYIGTH